MSIIRYSGLVIAALSPQAIASAEPLSAFDAKVAAIRSEALSDPHRALLDAETLQTPTDVSARNAAHRRASKLWVRAEALLALQQPNDTLSVLSDSVRRFAESDPNLSGELALVRARAWVALGRVQDALQNEQLAYEMFHRANNSRGRAKALYYMSSLYLIGGDYTNALNYTQQSVDTYANDEALLLSNYNNKAIAFSKLGKFSDAARAYKTALKYVGQDIDAQAVILSNLAQAQAEAGDLEDAADSLSKVFSLPRDKIGTNNTAALYSVAAFVELRRHRLPEAQALIEKGLAAVKSTDPETRRDIHHTAYQVYRAIGNEAPALKHLEEFQALDDQQRAVTASASAALMNARFNFTNQELRIRDLRVSQERAAARFRNRMSLALLSAAAIISTLLLIGFLSIRRSRNQVRAANTTLRSTNVALEKALAAKTEFLATTSHEIRTPLNGILGMTQVLLAGRQLDPTLRSRIELVHGAGETMKALVDDILDVAKMETGELRIQSGEMDLKRLLEDAVTVWTGQAETKRIGIAFALADCPGRIIADEVRLRQIIFNLMSNAIKFTDRGQVRLAAYAEERDGGEQLVVQVADSGIGIPGDRIDDIFESFRQVDGGVTRRHGGTGLGLAICRSLARAMGGDVTVVSTLGAGSTFTLAIPLERAAAQAPRTARTAATSLASAQMLMIEPNPLGQGIMRALLAGQSAGVEFVPDIPAALQLIDGGTIDYVVAEGSALGLDPAGAAALAQACADAHVRFTLLWREPTPELKEELGRLGVGHVVGKPISAPDLLSEMNKVYGGHIANRNIAA